MWQSAASRMQSFCWECYAPLAAAGSGAARSRCPNRRTGPQRRYLVLVGARLKLPELRVEHGELACDGFNARVQVAVLTVLHVEVVLIGLPLLVGAYGSVLPTKAEWEEGETGGKTVERESG